MPAERHKRLEDRGIHIPEFYTAHSWAVPRSIRRDTSMVVSLSQIGLAFHFFFPLFFSFFYISLLQKCNIIPQCCKEKYPFNAWNTLSPDLLELVGSRKTFFFGPNYFFFSPSRIAFGVLMWRKTKKIKTVALLSFATKMVPSQTRCAPASEVRTCGVTWDDQYQPRLTPTLASRHWYIMLA